MPARKSDVRKRQRSSSKNWLTRYVPRARTINAGAPGIGRSLKTKLITEFFYNIPMASGYYNGYLNVGSCFDPCGDLATIQPAGFDQLSAMFARYLVTGGHVDIECRATYSVAAMPTGYCVMAACYPSTVSTALTTYQAAASQPYSKTCSFNGVEKGNLRIKWDAQKIVGCTLPVTAEDHGALTNASPAVGQNVVVPIRMDAAPGATAVTSVVRVRIVQNVVFDQRIQNVDA